MTKIAQPLILRLLMSLHSPALLYSRRLLTIYLNMSLIWHVLCICTSKRYPISDALHFALQFKMPLLLNARVVIIIRISGIKIKLLLLNFLAHNTSTRKSLSSHATNCLYF
jgi:hypothetical protein